MSKGLEALNRIRKFNYYEDEEEIDEDCFGIEKELSIIEKELKEHEQYKDIEKELGVDLATLIKALKNGCCFKPWNRVYYDKHIKIEYEIDKWKLYDVFDNDYNVCDYGKTWALTRGELK